MFTPLRFALVAALAAAGGLTSASSTQSGSALDVLPACIQSDPTTQQPYWVGEPEAQVSRLGLELQDLADQHPDEIRGVSYCTHYEGVVVFVADRASDETKAALAEAAGRYPGVPASIEQGGLSLTELTSALATLSSNGLQLPGIGWYGPNLVTGGIDIGADPNLVNLDQLRQTLTASLSQIRVEVTLNLIPEAGVATNSVSTGVEQGAGTNAD
ncbi:hypothetical protein VRY54_04015 [Actinomyces sp. F1_1611]